MSSELKPTVQPAVRVMYDRKGRVYQPTVGPRLKIVLVLIFLLFAILGANSVYLISLTGLNWLWGQEYRNWFYLHMFFWHLVLGFILIVPFILFVALHLRVALKRPNRKAVRLGLCLLTVAVVLLGTGVVMTFQRQLFPTTSLTGQVVYWLHVLTPLAVIGLYILHRLAGPPIKWRYAKAWGGVVAVIVVGFGLMHFQDPRKWGVTGGYPEYFQPSSARTFSEDGGTPFIPASVLMNNEYCLQCHKDAYAGWFHSAHHFASFNNLAYRQTILDMRRALDVEVREVAREKKLSEDGDEFKKMRAKKLQATRWCAGCHDPVPFFSGKFDDDQFFKDLEINFPIDPRRWEDVSLKRQPTAHAGITCISCHGITHINSITGNADYTIQEPPKYPFQGSKMPILREISNALVKAKPDLHKRSMLKPFHRTAEFCMVCHKVHLPVEVNDYRWVRGQDHYDSWHNSGASGFGSRSFYHPPTAKKCSECHMPLMASEDFGNIKGEIHNHLFLGANTALPRIRQYLGERNHFPPIGDEEDVVRLHQAFLRDKRVRVDVFAIRERGEVDGTLHVVRPQLPQLLPGDTYLLEIVVRNLGVGHEFTQGTADSNEVWLHLQLASNGKVWAESGGLDRHGYNDPDAHYLNALILDRHGRRIDRRNAKDIFVPLFNHQIPPSSSQVVHYRLTVPKEQREPVEIAAQLKYRKFDRIYQDFFLGRPRAAQAATFLASNPFGGLEQLAVVAGAARLHDLHRGPDLPVTVLAEDHAMLPVKGGVEGKLAQGETPPQWERINDYGIGLLLQGDEGADRGLLRQAEAAFKEVTRLRDDYADGYLNLARVYLKEGRLKEMAQVLKRAAEVQPGYWKTAWLRGELNRENGFLDEAIEDFRRVLATKFPDRGFDFSKDREIRRQLGDTLFKKAQREEEGSPEQAGVLREAVQELRLVLVIDPEDRQSHWLLAKCYHELGDKETEQAHLNAYDKYQVDNSVRDYAVRTYRQAHPWADHSAQAVVIYELKRPAGSGRPDHERDAAVTSTRVRPGKRRRRE